MPRRLVSLRSEQNRLARLLALAMTVADLAGRAKVLDEAEAETGESFRPRRGLSFVEGPFLAKALRDAKTRRKFTDRLGELGGPWRLCENPAFADGDAIVLAPEKLEPKEALGFFRQRIAMTSAAFNRLEARYREVAFTVARVESVTLLEEIQGVLGDVLESGKTQRVFEQRVNELFKARGLDPLNPFHLDVVFRNNVSSAYNTGRASQMLQADVRRALPFWDYRTVLDDRVREKHRRLHGFVARYDDPVWRRIYPPNGHRCRCSVIARTEAKAKRLAGRTKQDLAVAGNERVPAEPDKGFDRSPVLQFERRLERGRAGLTTFGEAA